ncbi:MAG TPA: choice-of-anchor tandem repeat GloVer-containing protein [Terriglobia bacterium]|nr:choice-of-anchor tandem repeat GloVer-containing protein [Terriglobia bacterium]
MTRQKDGVWVGLKLTAGVVLLLLVATQAAQAQSFSDIYVFTGGSAGQYPFGPLIADSAGNLYGTTLNGGAYGYGTVYELPTTGGEIVLHSFTGGADGGYPLGGVLRDAKGDLYGTTQYGGNFSDTCPLESGCGVVFKLSPQGQEW